MRYTGIMRTRRQLSPRERVVLSLAGLTLVSVGLFGAGAVANRSLEFAYMLWNLFLAWLPVLVMIVLLRSLRTQLWSSWWMLALTFLWLILLPNSFYMISDFVHLREAAICYMTSLRLRPVFLQPPRLVLVVCT
jgi:uncharacterized membrane protein